ncbi:NAD(P)/FAD-dependent oxidoreductase [Labilithrix luteola]|uniref:NAD(P)/FAD-dependent oxidoreductase n=1 Tax=Labilithrix luteola TaxID=1391654 RepID=UPI000A892178|nr:NAD(P)/FAD-dependent oxidoreductase [Labilithrix luteola]
MTEPRQRVVIVGGGFGGLETAKALAGAHVDVTLVDRTNYHLFQPLLYQVAMAGLSPAEIAAPIRSILAEQDNVRVMLGEVRNVDLQRKTIDAGSCGILPYDWLVLAIGAKTSYFGHDDWERFAPGLKSIEDAVEIRRRVLVAFERAERTDDERERRKLLTFVVIGGGPTGVELAGAIAELARFVLSEDFRSIDPRSARVILVEAGARLLPSFPEDLARSAVDQLSELGVEVRTNARVVNIGPDGADLEVVSDNELPGLGSGKELDHLFSATVVWSAGVRANDLGARLAAEGVPLDRQGRVLVKDDCSLPGFPEVFAIGDMAHFEENGKLLPGVSPVAMQQGRYVARIISKGSRSNGQPIEVKPFRYLDKGSMATIGRSRAIAQAGKIKLSGFVAWLAWLVVHVWYLIGFRNRFVVLLTWAWSYVSYKRGARLITTTGWKPESSPKLESSVPPPPSSRRADGSRGRSSVPREVVRSPESDRQPGRAPTPIS